MEPQTSGREMSGNVMRELLAELKLRGLFDSVRAGVPPEAQALMDVPPLHAAWVPSDLYEALWVRLGQLAGREQVKEVACSVTRNSMGPSLPLVKTYFTLFGASPTTALKNVGKVISVQCRGIEFDYEPETERSGFMKLRTPAPLSDFVFASWEGALRLGGEITHNPTLKVERCEISEDGKLGRIRIHW
jgi:hypothetical protein